MFDPYRKWLGIPPKDQPPNHYRLLGLELFESDLDVIEGAADRQMNFVRQYQSGEHATAAAKILNELAMARLCLLKPATKKAYDKKLRAEQDATAKPGQDFPDLAFDDMQPAPRKGPKKSRPAKPAMANQPLLIGGGIVLLFIVLLVFMIPRGRKNPPVDQPTTPTGVTAASTSSSSKPATPAVSEPSVSPSILWTEPKLMVERAGEPIDLMKSVDIARDVSQGEWKQTSTALIAGYRSVIHLPAKLPDDYQIQVLARRLDGDEGFTVGFMMSGHQGMAVVDGWRSTLSGLFVDGREVKDNATTFRSKALMNPSAQIVVTVHPGHFHMAVDGKTITNWHGNPEQLSLFFGLGSRESVFLTSSDSSYVVESAKLIPLKPEPPVPSLEPLTAAVDVQSLIDLDRDIQRGVWGENRGKFSSPEGLGQILLPVLVPEEYTLSAKILRPENAGGEPTVMIGLIADQFPFRAVLKSDEGVALDMIDGRRWNENESRLEVPFCQPGIAAQVDCTVTKQGVRVEADGRTLIDWRGEPWRLSMAPEWGTRDSRKLFIATKGHFQFSDIKLGPPKPAKPLPRHDKITTDKPLDLLALIDPVRDAYQGTWKFEGGSLWTMADTEYTKLAIPAEVPEEFQLSMRVAREPAGGRTDDQGLCVKLPFGKTRAGLIIDGSGTQFSGLYMGKAEFNVNPTSYRGTVIPPGPAVDIDVEVRKTGIKVSSAGRQIIDWKGNPANFSVHPRQGGPGRGIDLGAKNQRFRFEKLEIRALPPSNVPALPSLPTDGKLLPIIDLVRDVREGTWAMGEDGLQSPDAYVISRLRIPCTPPSNYALEMTAERRTGRHDFLIGLLVDGRPCLISLDGSGGTRAGLGRVDGHNIYASENFAGRATKSHLLPQGQREKISCIVMPDTVIVNCGNREIVRWHGDPRRLSLGESYFPTNYSDEDRKRLWLGAWESNIRITDLVLRPLTTEEETELKASFTGVTPATRQADVPLATKQ